MKVKILFIEWFVFSELDLKVKLIIIEDCSIVKDGVLVCYLESDI